MDIEKLQQLQLVDIRTVEKESLVDIDEIKIPDHMSDEEKIMYFLDNIKNPYCYRQGDYVVKIKFSPEGGDITEKLKTYIDKNKAYE